MKDSLNSLVRLFELSEDSPHASGIRVN